MWKLFRVLKPYRVAITLVIILTFLQSLANLYLPTLMSDIVDTGIVQGNIPYIWRVGGWMLAVSALAVVFSIWSSYESARASAGFGFILRDKLFTHVENFSRQAFDKIGTATLITRTNDDITRLQQVLTMSLRMVIAAPIMAAGGIVMAISKNGRLSLLLVAVLPILALVIWSVTSRGVPLFRILQKKLDNLNLIVREALTGVRVIRAFNRVESENERFEEGNRSLMDTAIRVNRIMATLMPVMMLLMNLSTVAIVWYGSHLIGAGDMQVGDLMAFIQYAMQIMFSLLMVSMMFVIIPRGSVSAARINEVLDTAPEILDAAHPVSLPSVSGEQPTGQIVFQHVTFGYAGAEEPTLNDISFTANPGEITAIIGGTGAGKSTLSKLIPRFYDVTGGKILLDGVDIRDLTQAELRKQIGWVPQQPLLFTGTIADNIRYGKEDATDEEVRHAAEVAQAAGFIEEMEGQYDAFVTQGGTNLSGGQRQRLAIARALSRQPKVYLFDDCFSALDARTEARVRNRLWPETNNATVIIVSQKVSSIMYADKILVLDEGQLVGVGRHEELVETCSVYREIVSSQLNGEVGA